jgi:hypothetical protein
MSIGDWLDEEQVEYPDIEPQLSPFAEYPQLGITVYWPETTLRVTRRRIIAEELFTTTIKMYKNDRTSISDSSSGVRLEIGMFLPFKVGISWNIQNLISVSVFVGLFLFLSNKEHFP